ncbi:MAG: hypothetical protein K6U74_08790, partial [Firmicutes bacterium]|nr:hypothetical protein [Bacillota bacterium]
MKNSYKDYKNRIIFHAPTRRPDSGFVWFRGAYEIKKIDGRKYILPSGKVTSYTLTNISDLVLSLINMDWNNETEILNFTREYGLPGSANFLRQDREQLEKAAKSKWADLFEIKEEDTAVMSPMEQGVEWRDPAFWQTYREPLALFKLSVSRLK